jgi:RNA recognition motif-containing protein
VVFGCSSRTYKVTVDYSRMERAAEEEQELLEAEMEKLKGLENPDIDAEALKKTMGLTSQDTIFVTGFPYHYDESDFIKLFSECGKVEHVSIPPDRQNKQQIRGFAFIKMENPRAARKALNYDGHKIKEKRLKVVMADQKPEEKSNKPASSRHQDWNHDKHRTNKNRDHRREKQRRSRSYSSSSDKSDRKRRRSRSSSYNSERENRHRRYKDSKRDS